jgi:hypothetical protein
MLEVMWNVCNMSNEELEDGSSWKEDWRSGMSLVPFTTHMN